MRSAKLSLSSLSSSGVRVATTPRKYPSRVSRETRANSERSRSKKRSIALPTTAGSVEIFTLAIA